MLTEFPLPAMTNVAYKMPKVVDLMVSFDVLAIHVAYEMILCAAVLNIPVHVIVFELNPGSVAV